MLQDLNNGSSNQQDLVNQNISLMQHPDPQSQQQQQPQQQQQQFNTDQQNLNDQPFQGKI